MFCDRKNDNIVWLYVLLLSGSPFNGHPLFNEHIVKSLKLRPFSYCKFDLYQVVTSIQPTQSAFRISNWLILLYFTYIKWTCNQLQCGILSLQYKKHVHFLLTAGRTWHGILAISVRVVMFGLIAYILTLSRHQKLSVD